MQIQHIAIIVSAGSFLAAWFAAIMAYRSQKIAKRSLTIVEEQAIGRQPLIVPYLIEGFSTTRKDIKKKIYAFSISITNRSDIDNSITEIELFLNYYRSGQPMTSLLVPNNDKLKDIINIRNENILVRSLKLSSHQTATGWIMFDVDYTIIEDVIIDSYEIRITDSNGLYSKLQPIIITEIVEENEIS